MLLEERTWRFPQGSESNAYVPGVHIFSPSGSSGEPTIEVLRRTAQTPGASKLAVASGREMMELLRDISEVASFLRDPSMVWGLLAKQLPVCIAEEPPTDEQASSEDADNVFHQVDNRIRAALEAEPVEDGYTHPAEAFLEEVVRDKGQAAGGWLIDVISNRRWNGALTAGLLRLLSRQKPLAETWRRHIIQVALSSSDVELRDAGVQAAESWEDPATVEILQKHREQCAWLADYIRRVIRDLTR